MKQRLQFLRTPPDCHSTLSSEVFWKGGVWGLRGKSQSQKTTRRSRCSLESDAHGTKDDVTAYQKLCPSE
ncbi:hypothetical protein PRUPE_1G499500 [Prunus persica]|uniref:Uncharacterized protein n=1 Tax=Prunus persica TaxID=3760 RepID=A0A251RFH9_PRUPE|nr:hypothetical protein PRUPE_1G499500 [Prunus persica]